MLAKFCVDLFFVLPGDHMTLLSVFNAFLLVSRAIDSNTGGKVVELDTGGDGVAMVSGQLHNETDTHKVRIV